MAPFEEREAAKFNNYNWRGWQELSHDEKAVCIAYYRLHLFVALHRNDAQQRASEKEIRKGRRK